MLFDLFPILSLVRNIWMTYLLQLSFVGTITFRFGLADGFVRSNAWYDEWFLMNTDNRGSVFFPFSIATFGSFMF